MITFEISVDESTYNFMINELKKIRLIDNYNMTRNTFICLAILGQCCDLKWERERDENNLTIWGHSVQDE